MAGHLHWLDVMSVGRAEFDHDHQQIIEALSHIRGALERGDGGAAYDLAAGLLKLAGDHVDREEAFLRRIRFPAVDVVVSAQRASLSNIADLVARIPAEPTRAAKMVTQMEMAFVNYLLRADINFKSYVDVAGLRDV